MKKMTKILALALALALLGAAALAEVRTTANVWMRSEPNLRGEQITSFSENTKLEYLGATSIDERGVAWYKVKKGGNTGWVSSRYSELIGEESVVIEDHTGEAVDASAQTEAPAQTGEDLGGWFSAEGTEVSDYYLANLMEAATALGLNGFRKDEHSEVPYQYYSDVLTIAGYDRVEYIGLSGEGYSVFGVTVGMEADRAAALMDDAGLDEADSADGYVFEHRGGEHSVYVDEAGHDSNIVLEIDEGKVVEIHWSSYTG